jgi:hypothetical protein
MNKLDLIIDALRKSAPIDNTVEGRYKHRDAIDAARELRELEPVAWAATSEDGVVEELGFNKSHTRFDTPLYALGE